MVTNKFRETEMPLRPSALPQEGIPYSLEPSWEVELVCLHGRPGLPLSHSGW